MIHLTCEPIAFSVKNDSEKAQTFGVRAFFYGFRVKYRNKNNLFLTSLEVMEKHLDVFFILLNVLRKTS